MTFYSLMRFLQNQELTLGLSNLNNAFRGPFRASDLAQAGSRSLGAVIVTDEFDPDAVELFRHRPIQDH
jgi:hypothetical protein